MRPYRQIVDFAHPRTSASNVWQRLKSFKKHLFDSIPLNHFKYDNHDEKLSHQQWIDCDTKTVVMIPLAELSTNPIYLDSLNSYTDQTSTRKAGTPKIHNGSPAPHILQKPALTTADTIKGRKPFTPNTRKIEIDITYACNLKCFGCNRSCGQAPTSEHMTVAQIRAFIQSSIALGIKWRLINILRGEPTLHEDFARIVSLIQTDYADHFSPHTIIQVVSNGVTDRSRQLCEQVRLNNPNVRIDYNSYKKSNKTEYFSPFNDAPLDDTQFANADYSLGCWVTSYCGIGLNSRGYYCCASAAGIDRLIKSHSQITSLQDVTPVRLKEQLRKFCKYCGNYKAYAENNGDFVPRCEKAPFKNIVSPTCEQLYKAQ